MTATTSSTERRATLHVTVGETLAEAGARTASVMKALQRGGRPQPHFGVSFAEVGELFAAFTPRRWELIAALREGGPMTVAQLARRVGRNYKNVHGDVMQLIQWLAVERGNDGRVNVPWRSILVDLKLPERQAA